MSRVYTSADQLIGGTPLLELTHIEREEGLEARILGKLEYFNPAGSVKDRIAKAMIDDAEKKVRSKRLLDLSQQKRINFYARYIGTEQEVLFEKATRGKAMHGFSAIYIRVVLPAKLAKEEYDNQILFIKKH